MLLCLCTRSHLANLQHHVDPKDPRSSNLRLPWQSDRRSWLDNWEGTFPCCRPIGCIYRHSRSPRTSWWSQKRIPRKGSEEGSRPHQRCKFFWLCHVSFAVKLYVGHFPNRPLPLPCWRKTFQLLNKRLLTISWSNLMALRTSPSLVLMLFWESHWLSAKLVLLKRVFPFTSKYYIFGKYNLKYLHVFNFLDTLLTWLVPQRSSYQCQLSMSSMADLMLATNWPCKNSWSFQLVSGWIDCVVLVHY